MFTRLALGGLLLMSSAVLAEDIDALWDFANPSASESRFRARASEVCETGEKIPCLELRTQIARAQGLQGKFSEAHQTLDLVEAELCAEPCRARVRYLLERGRVLNSSREAGARSFFTEAFEMARVLGEDALAVDAAHMVAIVEPAVAGQIEWNRRAIEIAEASQIPRARAWLGSLYNNLGWTYHDSGDYAAALEIFLRAREFFELGGDRTKLRIAKWSVARAYRSLGRIREALDLQWELERELARAGEADGYVWEELGELHLLVNRPEEAKPYFAKAFLELSKDEWLRNREPARLERLRRLAGQ